MNASINSSREMSIGFRLRSSYLLERIGKQKTFKLQGF